MSRRAAARDCPAALITSVVDHLCDSMFVNQHR